ncbi:MAG: hypothetical protein R6U55_06460, partial [Desulfovermiculus sp.]
MLIILVGYAVSKQVVLKKILLAVSTIGLILSLWFLYVQLGIIGSLCVYCLLSLVSTLCVWIAVMVMNRPTGDIIKAGWAFEFCGDVQTALLVRICSKSHVSSLINPATFLFWALWPKKYVRFAGGKADNRHPSEGTSVWAGLFG